MAICGRCPTSPANGRPTGHRSGGRRRRRRRSRRDSPAGREQILQGASQVKLVGQRRRLHPAQPVGRGEPSPSRAARRRGSGTRLVDLCHRPRLYAASSRGDVAGAACIEHGHLMDEATAEIMADKDVAQHPAVPQRARIAGPCRPEELAKMRQVLAGTDTAYGLARKHGIKTAFGSDLLFSPGAGWATGTCSPTCGAGSRRPKF